MGFTEFDTVCHMIAHHVWSRCVTMWHTCGIIGPKLSTISTVSKHNSCYCYTYKGFFITWHLPRDHVDLGMKMEVYRPVPILVKLFVDPPKVLQQPKWRHPHSNLDLSLVPFQERKFRFLKEFYGVHVAVMFSSGNDQLNVRTFVWFENNPSE